MSLNAVHILLCQIFVRLTPLISEVYTRIHKQPDVHSRNESARGNKQVFLRGENDKDAQAAVQESALITFLLKREDSGSVLWRNMYNGINGKHTSVTGFIREDRPKRVFVAQSEASSPPKAHQKHEQAFDLKQKRAVCVGARV